MSSKINPAWQAWNDLQNEGAEGFNPHAKWIAAAPVRAVSSDNRMLRDERGNLIPAAKLAARLAKDESRLSKIADLSARLITQQSIDFARAQLGA